MNVPAWWTVPIGLAAVLDGGMAIAHFGLQWEWRQVTDFGGLPAQLQWALFALNFSWGVLLLGVAILIGHAARIGPADSMGRRLVLIVGFFWAIHGAYVAAVPMPLPPQLTWIRLPILAFPAMLVLLHSTALAATTETRMATARSQNFGQTTP